MTSGSRRAAIPRRDLAKGTFGLGALGDGGLRALQLADEMRVGDGDRRLVGQTAEDRGVHVVEGMPLSPVDLDGAQRPLVADDRSDDEVADAGGPGQLVGRGQVGELPGEVVSSRDDPALAHRPARQALAHPEPCRLDGRALLLGQTGVIGRDQHAHVGVVLVDHRAVGTEQPERLIDDALEEVARLADGGDPGGDLAQRLFRLGATLDDGPRPGEFVHEACVPDRDRRLRGESRQDLGVRLVVGGHLARHDRQRAERGRLAGQRGGIAGERDGDHRADARVDDERVRPVVADEPIVGEVVVGAHRPLLGEGGPGDRLARLETAGHGPLRDRRHRVTRGVRPAQGVDLGIVDVDPGAVRFEQPGRLVDDPLEHLVGLEDRRHAGRDLAQGPLRVGTPGDLRSRPLELLDEPGVGDGHRRLVGQGRQECRILRVEGVRPVAVDGDGTDDDVAVDERRRDDRLDAAGADERVALLGVGEPVVLEVVAGPFDLAGLHRPAGDAGIGRQGGVFEQRQVDGRAVDRFTAGPHVGHRGCPDEVDHRADRAHQPDRRVDDRLEDLFLVVRRADATGDLAQRPFRVGGPRQLLARVVELFDEPGIGDGDGGLAGESTHEARVGLAERPRRLRVHLDDAHRTAVAGDRRRDHRLEPGPLVELGGFGRRRELRREVAVGEDDPALRDRDPGRADTDRDPEEGPFLGA